MPFETTAEFAAIQARTHLEHAIDSLDHALRWARTADSTSGVVRYRIVTARDELRDMIADIDWRAATPITSP